MSTYTVKAGDSLSRIAAAHGTTAAALASANGITDPNKIRAGQVLTVPTPGISSPGRLVALPKIDSRGVLQVDKAPDAVANQPGSWWNTLKAGFSNPGDLIRSVGETYGMVQQTRLNEKLAKINLDRVQQGMDPLDPSVVRDIAPAPRVEVGLEANTRQDLISQLGKPLLLGGLGLGALMLVLSSRNSSPASGRQ